MERGQNSLLSLFLVLAISHTGRLPSACVSIPSCLPSPTLTRQELHHCSFLSLRSACTFLQGPFNKTVSKCPIWMSHLFPAAASKAMQSVTFRKHKQEMISLKPQPPNTCRVDVFVYFSSVPFSRSCFCHCHLHTVVCGHLLTEPCITNTLTESATV